MREVRNFLKPNCVSSSSQRHERTSDSNFLMNSRISTETSRTAPSRCSLPVDIEIRGLVSHYESSVRREEICGNGMHSGFISFY